MTTLKVMGTRVVLERPPQNDKVLASGLIMPEGNINQNTIKMKVTTIGPKCMAVQEGDMVLVPNNMVYVGSPFEIDGTEYVMILEEDILGIVEE